jgi:hypothetical protein
VVDMGAAIVFADSEQGKAVSAAKSEIDLFTNQGPVGRRCRVAEDSGIPAGGNHHRA